MKKTFIYLALGAVLAFAAVSCETYKVDEPDMTNVAWIDGHYVAAALDPANPADTLSVFSIEITNTTNDDPDLVWFTITDYSAANSEERVASIAPARVPYVAAYLEWYGYIYFPAAYRFAVSCSEASSSFYASSVDAVEPTICYNYTLGGPAASACGRLGGSAEYKVSVSGGKIGEVDTPTGYKAASIEFTFTIESATPAVTYLVRGIKNTGWAGDTQNYQDWILGQVY